MESKLKHTKRPKRLVIDCCNHNMCVFSGYYDNGFAIRERFCNYCHKTVYTVQYINEDEKLIDEDILKKAKEANYES